MIIKFRASNGNTYYAEHDNMSVETYIVGDEGQENAGKLIAIVHIMGFRTVNIFGDDAQKFLDAFAGDKHKQFEELERSVDKMIALLPTPDDGVIPLNFVPRLTLDDGTIAKGAPISFGFLYPNELRLISSALGNLSGW